MPCCHQNWKPKGSKTAFYDLHLGKCVNRRNVVCQCKGKGQGGSVKLQTLYLFYNCVFNDCCDCGGKVP